MNKLRISKEVYNQSQPINHMDELREGANCTVVRLVDQVGEPDRDGYLEGHVIVESNKKLYYISLFQLFRMTGMRDLCSFTPEEVEIPEAFTITRKQDREYGEGYDLNASEKSFHVEKYDLSKHVDSEFQSFVNSIGEGNE